MNFILALGTVGLLAAFLVLLCTWGYERFARHSTGIGNLARRVALPGVFALSLAATMLTLVYSEVFGIVPCGLCWFQRIFLYPQVIVAGIALLRHQGALVVDYLLALSVPGLLIALYQHYIQMGGSELVDCPAAAGDCAKRFVFEFGFVTFPFMAAVIFAVNIVLLLLLRTRAVS